MTLSSITLEAPSRETRLTAAPTQRLPTERVKRLRPSVGKPDDSPRGLRRFRATKEASNRQTSPVFLAENFLKNSLLQFVSASNKDEHRILGCFLRICIPSLKTQASPSASLSGTGQKDREICSSRIERCLLETLRSSDPDRVRKDLCIRYSLS